MGGAIFAKFSHPVVHLTPPRWEGSLGFCNDIGVERLYRNVKECDDRSICLDKIVNTMIVQTERRTDRIGARSANRSRVSICGRPCKNLHHHAKFGCCFSICVRTCRGGGGPKNLETVGPVPLGRDTTDTVETRLFPTRVTRRCMSNGLGVGRGVPKIFGTLWLPMWSSNYGHAYLVLFSR